MPRLKTTERQGQALVEFALITGVLLLILFVIVEGAHLLHANLTVQNAARAAGRYAITGQFETDCLLDSPPCEDPKVASIKAVAEEELAGLSLDPNAVFEEAGYFLVEVFGADATGQLIEDSAGMPGRPIVVRVSYRAPIWTPLLRPIAETVMVSGQTVMNNEKVVQVGSAGDTVAPPVDPPPPIEPTPPPPPDLVLDKSAPSSVVEGASFNYTLSLVNNGQQAATNVQLIDNVPGAVTVVSASPTGECSQGGSPVTCTWSSLAAGESKSVSINVNVNSGTAGQTITNTASVSLDQTDANSSDNTAQATTDIVADTTETDLAIIKTGPESAPVSTASDTFYVDYEITVRNNGPNSATGVEVTDPLGGGLTFVASGSSAECSGSTSVTCTLGDMPNGAVRALAIRAQTPDTTGPVTNTATVAAAGPADFDISNNDDSHTTQFIFLADLEISKTGSPSTVIAGELLTYSIEVWNHPDSPHTATGVYISDPLPNDVELQSTAYSAPGGNGTCAVSGSVVTCPIGTLEPGEHAFATIEVIPQRAGTLINSATVAGEQNDPDTINSATAVTMVDAVSDLSILKSVEPDVIFAGDVITYTLAVRNDGPSRATGVTVVDQMPADVIFQNVQSDYGSCEWHSDLLRVTCGLGAMPAGQQVTIRITAIPFIPEKEFENVASVNGNEPDPVDNNNSAVTTTAQEGLPFIVLDPSCGPEGTAIQIEGYLWSGNRDVTLTWQDGDGNTIQEVTIRSNEINNQTGRFSYLDSVGTVGAYKETIRITAEQEAARNSGLDPVSDTELFRVPCPAPDLEVSSLSTTAAQVEQYEPVTYTVTIENTGNRAANEAFFVSLYAFDQPVDSATTHLSANNRLDAGTISALSAGSSIELTLRADSGFAITGTHYIYALVDSDPGPSGEIVEMYETNNLAGATIEVIESSADPPQDPPTGEEVLSGETYIATSLDGSSAELQPLVKVSIYDQPGGVWLATTYSDQTHAQYAFTSLPQADDYYVEASITVDGVLYTFTGTVSPPSQTLVLYPE